MIKIIRTIPFPNHYVFIRENYPWNWGSYEKFFWKHIDDPFHSNDFYELRNDGQILGLCVARPYPFVYKGKNVNIISMMDFVTHKKFRNKKIISYLSDYVIKYIENDINIDLVIGFSGEELFHKIYKTKIPIQIFYTYRFAANGKRSGFCYMNNLRETFVALNSNSCALQVMRDETYINHITRCPDFQQIIFAKTEGLIFGMGIREQETRILELSEYNVEACLAAVCAAKTLGKDVVADFPIPLDRQDAFFEKKLFALASGKMAPFFLEEKRIWIPNIERK